MEQKRMRMAGGPWLVIAVFVTLCGMSMVLSQTAQADEPKSSPWSEIQIVKSDASGEGETKTSRPLVEGETVDLDALNQRSEKVSQYGTFAVIQKPIEWSGKALDALVSGIGKLGSVFIDCPAKLVKKKGSSK